MTRTRVSAIAIVGLLFSAVSVAAGTITGVTPFGPNDGTGPGLGTVDVVVNLTLNADNDNQTGGGPEDNNIEVPVKVFENAGYIDIEFQVVSSNGVTEYKVTESVDNDTGLLWSSYTMQLGFGTGENFQPSPANDGLDFDHPDFDTPPSSTAFSTVAMGEDLLTFSGGLQGTGSKIYAVRIDVPNLPAGSFTLRQTPIAIPEPSSLAIAGLAALGLVGSLRRQEK